MFKQTILIVSIWALSLCSGCNLFKARESPTVQKDESLSLDPKKNRGPSPISNLNVNIPRFPKGHPKNFTAAKRLLKKIFQQGQDYYCGCDYDLKKSPQVYIKRCGFESANKNRRSSRIEWEHVVPASAFASSIPEWLQGSPECVKQGKRYKGRSCARKASKVFRKIEADLFNLVPTIGELNAKRSNLILGEIEGEARAYGSCDFEFTSQLVEPPEETKGDLARIYFYMNKKYRGYLSFTKDHLKQLSKWNNEDPLSNLEVKRLERILKIQEEPYFRRLIAMAPTTFAIEE